MGLDIYLYDRARAEALDARNKASEEFYERYDSLTEDERAAWHKASDYPGHEDVPSERYPKHLFNRRYLHSSYNGVGFDHAVPQLLGWSGKKTYPNEPGGLYWIFEPMGRAWDGDEGRLAADDIPKLEACRERAREVVAELGKADRLRVMTVSPNMFSPPPTTTDTEALQAYREHMAERPERPAGGPIGEDTWYSTRDLEIYGKTGATILAAIPGVAPFSIPGVHLIFRANDDAFASYVESAEIVVEFCDEAIMLIERDGEARLSWSG